MEDQCSEAEDTAFQQQIQVLVEELARATISEEDLLQEQTNNMEIQMHNLLIQQLDQHQQQHAQQHPQQQQTHAYGNQLLHQQPLILLDHIYQQHAVIHRIRDVFYQMLQDGHLHLFLVHNVFRVIKFDKRQAPQMQTLRQQALLLQEHIGLQKDLMKELLYHINYNNTFINQLVDVIVQFEI